MAYEKLDFPLFLRLLASWPEQVVTAQNTSDVVYGSHYATCINLLYQVQAKDSVYVQMVLDAIAERTSPQTRVNLGTEWFKRSLGTCLAVLGHFCNNPKAEKSALQVIWRRCNEFWSSTSPSSTLEFGN